MAKDGQPATRILQVDADAFFVQVARLVDPEGAGRASLLLVGGSPKGRGVVTSAAYEARAFGVHSGMPMAQALRLCPDATVIGVSRGACSDRSRRIVTALRRFSPVVEPASIDEMYVDLTGTEGLYAQETLADLARRIRVAVLDESEIVVSIGGGANRLVAKLAAGRAKPHRTPDARGVLVVPPGDEAAFLATFDLADIPGVGPRFQERLARHGLTAVRDALAIAQPRLTEWLGVRAAGWLYRRIRGIGSRTVHTRERAKSLSRDATFPTDITDGEELVRRLVRLVDRAVADLRKHRYTARTITVKIRDYDFTTRQKSRTLSRPIAAERVVATVARDLLVALRQDRNVPARLLGVALSQLSTTDRADQLELFADDDATEESARDRIIAHTLDQVREKFGDAAVVRGAALDSTKRRDSGLRRRR